MAGFNKGGNGNMQSLMRQAQKMQEEAQRRELRRIRGGEYIAKKSKSQGLALLSFTA